MFTKQEIIRRRQAEIFNARARGENAPPAGLNLAVMILGSALYGKTQWSGEDYAGHPILVAVRNTRSTTKQIIGVLHDVVEDSDWTLDDLRDVGFAERVVAGVDAMSRRVDQGERYFDFIERCSLNKDATDVKINDLEHNSTHTRNISLMTPRVVEKQNLYIISYNYLVAIKKGEIERGSSIRAFVASRPELDPGEAVLDDHSARRAEKPAPVAAPAFGP